MKWFGGDVNRESNWRTAAVNKDNKTLALHIKRSRRRYSLEAYIKRSVSQDKIEEMVVWFGLGWVVTGRGQFELILVGTTIK